MSVKWPRVRLGEVLNRSAETVAIQPDTEYREITVRLWGKGVVLRGAVNGATISAARRFVARPGQIILSRIDARNGAIGIVPSELDGAVITNDFPVFNPVRTHIEPAFLDWLTKTPDFVDLCQRTSEGTTNRVRLQEARFLGLEIPLPPLAEQRRIVARIEQLATQINEARTLRQQAAEEAEVLWPATLKATLLGRTIAYSTPLKDNARHLLDAATKRHRGRKAPGYNNASPDAPAMIMQGPIQLPASWVWTTLGSVLTDLVDCVNDTPDFAPYDTGLLGLKSSNVRPYRLSLSERWFMSPEDFGRWNRREQPIPGDILLTREAPMGYACMLPEGHQVCLTQRLMLLRVDPETVIAKFVLHYLNSPVFSDQVAESCRGLTTPHIRVQDAPKFLFPLPPMDEQRGIVAYLDAFQAKVDAQKHLQAQTAAELDALLPSILDRAFKGEL